MVNGIVQIHPWSLERIVHVSISLRLLMTWKIFSMPTTKTIHSSLHRTQEDNPESVWKEMIASFRTPFWMEDNHWLIICRIFSSRREADVYTSPICISHYTHIADLEKMKTISNFGREDQHSTTRDSPRKTTDAQNL
jgi:hypothetical protein